jgi:cysteinyl-tRNA synthetase
MDRALLLGAVATLRRLGALLGLFQKRVSLSRSLPAQEGKLIDLLIEVRRRAREAKRYDLADYIREQLSDLGVALEDTVEGTVWRWSS